MATTEKRRRSKKLIDSEIVPLPEPTWGKGLFGRLTEPPQEYEVIYTPDTIYPLKTLAPQKWIEEKADPWRQLTVGHIPCLGMHRYPGGQVMVRGVRPSFERAAISPDISDRVNLLLDLVGETHVVDALRPLETSADRQVWLFRFDEDRPATITEYISFLGALNSLYQVFLTVLRVEYFVNVWVKSKPIEISTADELRVVSITKHSPESLKVEGLAAGLKAVGEALSIGDQVQKIRTAGVKVDEAKLELRKKEIELAEVERQAKIRASGTELDVMLEIEKKHVELDALRRKAEEEDLKLAKLKLEYFGEAFATLSKTLLLLEKMPQSLRASFEQLLQQKIDELLIQPPYRLQAAEVVLAAEKSNTA